MTEDGGYDLAPKPEKPPSESDPTPAASAPQPTPETANTTPNSPKPGEPGWVPPTPVIEPPDADPEAEYGDPNDPDVQTHKGLAILAYIFFLIPLIAAPNSKYARYHANQGLLLFILLVISVVAVVILHLGVLIVDHFVTIGILKFFFDCGFNLLQFALLAGWVGLTIAGIINAANGLKKPLPVVGHWKLIH